ncbi:MAG: CapA family protein [Firmicutes bacterium]|nr:CapA family protein [Bacillota bacterium]
MRSLESSPLRRLLLLALVLAALTAGIWYHLRPGPVLEADRPAVVHEQPGRDVRLNAVGDIMLGRHVGTLISRNGVAYPFGKLAGPMADADFTFANLESPLSQRGTPLEGKPVEVVFRADPGAIDCLPMAGIDIVSLANNHTVDYDSPALLDTIEFLKQVGIRSVGAGIDIQQARQPVVLEKDGLKLAFLAYTDLADIYFSDRDRRAPRATAKRPGVAPLDEKMMLEDVARARTLADRVVVSLHWGTEYQGMPSSGQQVLAHRLVDAGADLIIGHHPHWFQGVEVYKGRVIAYSLGNFVMDQNWSNETREGLFLQVDFMRDGTLKARVRPVFINNSQPQWVEGEHQQRLLNRVVAFSSRLNTRAAVDKEWVEYGR